MKLRSTPQFANVILPVDSAERKTYPLYSGLFALFPNALTLIAHQSYGGQVKHCEPGEEMQWAFDKSNDHLDCMLRHTTEEDWAAAGWRAVAHLETKIQEGWRP